MITKLRRRAKLDAALQCSTDMGGVVPADETAADPHQPLREDVRLLGELLGRTLQEQGGGLYERVEHVRALAKSARDADDDFNRLAELLRETPIESALPVARAFAHFLNLANIAEQHHRVRRRREHARDPEGRPQRGSCQEAFRRFATAGVSTADLVDAVGSLRIELVLTAHPTEIARRTLIQKHNRIAKLLAFRDRCDLTPAEEDDSLAALQREIGAAWGTDEVRRGPVSPLDEVRAGLVVFEQSLWDALPEYLRLVDRALLETTGQRLPLGATPITFGSWIGGDRDGNPNVTPEITRQATWLARWMAAELYLREINALRSELSLSAETVKRSRDESARDELLRRAGSAREPYRAVLADVRDRLRATRAWAETALAASAGFDAPRAGAPPPYVSASELAEPLELCFRALVSSGNRIIASGRLKDILRRVAAFGVTLARLDIRQDAKRHTEAVEWIAKTERLGAYGDASEENRQQLLLRELGARRIVFDGLPLDEAPDPVKDVLETFHVAARLNPESLGAYVITMASMPSDVLAVEWLQSVAGNQKPQRVVPLFETADDLKRSGLVMRDLLAIGWYRQRIGGRQEVMVGYSDSAKDAGRFGAAWSLYRAQEDIVAACSRAGVELTLFHGRGGSIGRGGGPTYLAVQSQPPGSVRGALRVTEQGEMLQAKFGLADIALRTLEVYTTATLDAMFAPQAAPREEWRACMERLAADARAAYRSAVYDDPQFVPYFRAATPEPELRLVNIGSRPSRREHRETTGPGEPGGNVALDSLRAIPWQFAWTQTRLMLPSWLGMEEALAGALARGEGESLHDMYARWPFFQSTIELIEMALAKADGRIAAQYDRLVPRELRPLGADMRARLARAIELVLTVTGHRGLLQTNPVLRRSIDVRNPYVDPINLVQVELLRRLRERDPDSRLRDAFVVTVNGIAAGMRNTG